MKVLFILLLASLLVGCQPNPSTPSQNTIQTSISQESGTDSAAAGSTDSKDTTGSKDATTGIYQSITGEKVKEWLDGGEDIIIVDVRTQGEFDSGHIPGALLIPNETIGSTEPSELPNKDVVIVVYCRSGRRSQESANKLLNLGYQKVYDLGGIGNWPYDLETNNQ